MKYSRFILDYAPKLDVGEVYDFDYVYIKDHADIAYYIKYGAVLLVGINKIIDTTGSVEETAYDGYCLQGQKQVIVRFCPDSICTKIS